MEGSGEGVKSNNFVTWCVPTSKQIDGKLLYAIQLDVITNTKIMFLAKGVPTRLCLVMMTNESCR